TSGQQYDRNRQRQNPQQRSDFPDAVFEKRNDITPYVNGRLARRHVAHNLLCDPVRVSSGLLDTDAILDARNHLISPKAGVVLGEFLGREAHGHPELRLIETAVLQRELKTSRHHTDDGVGFAVESYGSAQYPRITLVARQPQGITDHCMRLAGIFFLLSK